MPPPEKQACISESGSGQSSLSLRPFSPVNSKQRRQHASSGSPPPSKSLSVLCAGLQGGNGCRHFLHRPRICLPNFGCSIRQIAGSAFPSPGDLNIFAPQDLGERYRIVRWRLGNWTQRNLGSWCGHGRLPSFFWNVRSSGKYRLYAVHRGDTRGITALSRRCRHNAGIQHESSCGLPRLRGRIRGGGRCGWWIGSGPARCRSLCLASFAGSG